LGTINERNVQAPLFTTIQFAIDIGRGSRCKKITPVFLVIG
jgi:hypothetical protein